MGKIWYPIHVGLKSESCEDKADDNDVRALEIDFYQVYIVALVETG